MLVIQRVHLGPSSDEGGSNLFVAIQCGEVQRSLFAEVGFVRLGSGFEQKLNCRKISVCGGDVKWGCSERVFRSQGRLANSQLSDGIHVALFDRSVQRQLERRGEIGRCLVLPTKRGFTLLRLAKRLGRSAAHPNSDDQQKCG